MIVAVNVLVTLIIGLIIRSEIAINRVTNVPSAKFFAPVISNALSGLVDGVPDQASQALITELEARLTQITGLLQATNTSLEHEITDRLSKEDEFRRSTEQLRELSARLQSVREEERTHLARAIHDELGQALTGLKMDVAWLQKHLDQPQPVLLEKTQAMSDREFQVMQMMASGKMLAEIAETLLLNAKTVSTYRTRLLEKMNLKTNAEIIRYAIENGLIE
jgi:DNA-binding CsgD family transcriptional regulator